MLLTDNEKKMIENLINNEFNTGLDACPWVFALQEGCNTGNEFGEMEYKGVLGSLVKKELVVVMDYEGNGNSDDNIAYLTDKGKKIAKELFTEKYDWL